MELLNLDIIKFWDTEYSKWPCTSTEYSRTIIPFDQLLVVYLMHLEMGLLLPTCVEPAVSLQPHTPSCGVALQPCHSQFILVESVSPSQCLFLFSFMPLWLLSAPIYADPSARPLVPGESTAHSSLASSAKFQLLPISRSLINILNRTVPRTEPWRTTLVTGLQPDCLQHFEPCSSLSSLPTEPCTCSLLIWLACLEECCEEQNQKP